MTFGGNVRISVIRNNGNTLYVGGSGPGNYSVIQDVVDNASDGDTVYVFSGVYSDFFYNHYFGYSVLINKTINLIGEDKNTTIIDGQNITKQRNIIIQADSITITGFTIRYCGTTYLDTGILIIDTNNNTISNCIFYENHFAIFQMSGKYNIVKNNDFQENTYCIEIEGKENNFFNNNLRKNVNGIVIEGKENMIFDNIITENEIAIGLGGNNNIVTNNHIFNNTRGIGIFNSKGNGIEKNNIILNNYQAYFETNFFKRNAWRKNYWNRPRILPKVIFGLRVTDIIIWRFLIDIPFPSVEIDWHPAKEPYDIGR